MPSFLSAKAVGALVACADISATWIAEGAIVMQAMQATAGATRAGFVVTRCCAHRIQEHRGNRFGQSLPLHGIKRRSPQLSTKLRRSHAAHTNLLWLSLVKSGTTLSTYWNWEACIWRGESVERWSMSVGDGHIMSFFAKWAVFTPQVRGTTKLNYWCFVCMWVFHV